MTPPGANRTAIASRSKPVVGPLMSPITPSASESDADAVNSSTANRLRELIGIVAKPAPAVRVRQPVSDATVSVLLAPAMSAPLTGSLHALSPAVTELHIIATHIARTF